MEILLSPVTISVVLLTVICLLKFNLILAIIIAAIFTGFFVGMPLDVIMATFIRGMARHNNIALAYILLGALAYGIQASGLARKFANVLEMLFGKTGKLFLLVLAVVASFSQNLIPIHIAFIPILVPPLLALMNKLKIDRRAAANSLAFGLKAPYILIPAGFGLIFHNILATNINDSLPEGSGMYVTAADIFPIMVWPFLAMVGGLLVAVFISYRKPREYADLPLTAAPEDENMEEGFTRRHWGALLGAFSAFAVQIWAGIAFEGSPLWALSVGATLGLVVMLCFGTIRYNKMDDTVKGGIKLMGFIAFIMLVAVGYGEILRDSGAIDELVYNALNLAGNNRLMAVIAMQLIGLLITMGIGTSFGTIPLISLVFVPFMVGMGFSPAAIIVMIATAGATGDAGMPASDTALGPTAGRARARPSE
jgi:predicted histidine transporter YuiF (NhaC family)